VAASRRKGGNRAVAPRTGRTGRLGRVALALLALLALAAGGAAALWFSLPDPTGFAARTPVTTALMDQRRAEASRSGKPFRPDYRPVTLDRISPRLQRAVVASEDASFFGHAGFDWDEIRNAAAQNWKAGRTIRGASTITQQLAKNLWLGTERSWLRKAREALLTVKMERSLGKRRILTLYLDVAEWGNGVFGAQAAVLAAMLPAPRRAALTPAPRWLARRARRILGLLERNGTVAAGEAPAARDELERLLAAPPLPSDADEEPPEDR